MKKSETPEERAIREDEEANIFAMCLLMPEEIVRKEVAKLRPPIDLVDGKSVRKLAKKFEVSETLMLLRLGQIFKPECMK